MTEREAAWADLMRAAARPISADPEATSFGKRDAVCIVGVWPDARHDLDHWPPRDVIRLEAQGLQWLQKFASGSIRIFRRRMTRE